MKRFIIYPFLFGLTYALFKDFRPSDTLWIAGIITLIFWGLIAVLQHFVKNWHRASYIALLILIWISYYGTAISFMMIYLKIEFYTWHYLISVVAWTLGLFIVGSNWLWKRIHNPKNVTIYLNLVFLILCCYKGYQVYRIESHRFLESPIPSLGQVTSTIETTTLPDIYYIITDGYSRQDTLWEIFQYDNSPFIKLLSSKGFYVAEQNNCNYMQTVQSITSSLNLNYLNSNSISTVRRSEFIDLISNNEARLFLESLGYRTVTFSSYYYYTDINNSDDYYSLPKHGAPYYPATQVIGGSIGALLMKFRLLPWQDYRYQDHQKRVYFTLEELGTISSSPGPKFVFAHIVAPHPAYIFNSDGPVTPDKTYNYLSGSQEENIKNYPNQLVYLNRLLENMIDTIMKNSAFAPIIIIQADHGSNVYFDLSSIERTCIRERAAILNAYFFPDQDYSSMYPTITPVNSFRLIFNKYFGAQFDILDDQVFYSSGSHPFLFLNVTDRITQACSPP
jgi:hypothetical protein